MRRLYSRVYVHMLLVLVVSSLAVWLVAVFGFRSEYRRGIGHRLSSITAALVAEHFDDPQARHALIERLGRDLGIELTLRDPEGKVLVATGEPLPPLSPSEARELGDTDRVFVRGRHPFAAAVIRQPGSGRALGVLEAGLPRSAVPHLLQPLAYVAVLLVVIGVMAAPLAHRLSKPVERLTEATRRFGEGDLGYRIALKGASSEASGRDELERLELAWNDMAGRVESLVRSHRELIANVSHELRSPLTRLRLVLELLPSSPEVRQRTAEIERELGDLDRLVEALLTVARLEVAALPITREPLAAAALLESVRARAAGDPLLAGRPVEVSADAALTLVGDEALLRRALRNLFDNAVKYGAGPITLFAQAEKEELVRLGVQDLGPGIPEGERERVLAPFSRGPAARESSAPGGFGLGLTLASRIAQAHGGALCIEDAAGNGVRGQGCRVSLTVPQTRG
jgi:two-component system OmpR family sensor kinase